MSARSRHSEFPTHGGETHCVSTKRTHRSAPHGSEPITSPQVEIQPQRKSQCFQRLQRMRHQHKGLLQTRSVCSRPFSCCTSPSVLEWGAVGSMPPMIWSTSSAVANFLSNRLHKAADSLRGVQGVQQAVGRGILPLDRDADKGRVYVLPAIQDQKDVSGFRAAVKDRNIIKLRRVLNLNRRVIPCQVRADPIIRPGIPPA